MYRIIQFYRIALNTVFLKWPAGRAAICKGTVCKRTAIRRSLAWLHQHHGEEQRRRYHTVETILIHTVHAVYRMSMIVCGQQCSLKCFERDLSGEWRLRAPVLDRMVGSLPRDAKLSKSMMPWTYVLLRYNPMRDLELNEYDWLVVSFVLLQIPFPRRVTYPPTYDLG